MGNAESIMILRNISLKRIFSFKSMKPHILTKLDWFVHHRFGTQPS